MTGGMDLSFFRRAEARLAGAAPARLDYGLFVAALRSAAGPEPCRSAPPAPRTAAAAQLRDPIAEILLAGPRWRDAVAAQGGSFNPAAARKGGVN
jgi:hypothetical protein